MKRCIRCEEVKPLSDFSQHPTAEQGVRPDCKPCRAAYCRAARAKNLQKARKAAKQRQARWRKAHPEKAAVQAKASNARRAEKTASDPETTRASRRAYYLTMSPAQKAQITDWSRNRKARLRERFVAPVSFDEILIRDLGRCGICGELILTEDINIDHIVPLAADGWHAPDNVQLAHGLCNRKKGAKLPEAA